MPGNTTAETVDLSHRELRLVQLALMGLSDKTLAQLFMCSTDNINSCFLRLQDKLQVRDRTRLFHRAIRDVRFRPWVKFLLSWGGGTASLLEDFLAPTALERETPETARPAGQFDLEK